MALNLVRNSKVFFTTNLDTAANGYRVKSTGFTAANTYEIQVLDGFSFSQNTNNEVINVMEAGATPVRGQRSFNTSLAPVDFSFSNYIRPLNTGTEITAEESVLWNALLSDQDISTANKVTLTGSLTAPSYTFNNGTGTLSIKGTTLVASNIAVGDVVVVDMLGTYTTTPDNNENLNTAGTVTSISSTVITIDLANPPPVAIITFSAAPSSVILFKSAWAPVSTKFSYVSSAGSNKHRLQKFGLVFIVDQVVYAIDDCALVQASIDFGLDAIATAAWTGQGTALRQLGENITSSSGAFNAVTTVLDAGTISSITTSGVSPNIINKGTLTLTTPVLSNLNVGAIITSTGVGSVGSTAVVTSISYAADGKVTAFTYMGTANTTATIIGAVTNISATLFGGGTYTQKQTTASYITNKLSTVSLKLVNKLLDANNNVVAPSGTSYTVALTGGNITINNNVTYVTPAILGVVNIPVGYYTGARAISGSLNAYLRTGSSTDTGQLLEDMLRSSPVTIEPMFALSIAIGGSPNTIKVVLDMPSTVISIPTVDVQQVVSTAINFTAQGSTPSSIDSASIYDLTETNDISIRYYS